MRAKASLSVHDRLFVLDLDRCLITDTMYDVFDATIADVGTIDIGKLHEARAQREASGESFDMSGWLLRQAGLDESAYQQLINDYVARAQAMGKDHFLTPGARELLSALATKGIPHLIMTYGGQQNQVAKMRAAQLDSVPYIVVEQKYKAHYIQEWWDDVARAYVVLLGDDIIAAETVVLVDDKAGAFDDLPESSSARGYWLKAEPVLASQQGSIPTNVRPISSLTEILTLEQLV